MKRREKRPQIDGLLVPPELLDPVAPVWRRRRLYLAYMAERGWSLPPQERMGCPASPARRRQRAATGWAAENDIISKRHRVVDWHRLRALGLIE